MEHFLPIHAPALFAFDSTALTVQTALVDEATEVPFVELCYTVCGDRAQSGKLRMLPVDGFCMRECYSVFTATLPVGLLEGGRELCYHFSSGTAQSEDFRVPLLPMPEMPPLAVTETGFWNGGITNALELLNPTDRTVDLYDFELVLLDEKGPVGRNPLADEPGKSLLPAGERTALRFLTPLLLNRFGETARSPHRFFSELAERYPATCADIMEREPVLMQVNIAEHLDGKGYTLAEGCFEPPCDDRAHSYCLVRRGESHENAFFTIRLCYDKERRDLRRSHAQLWYFDPRMPANGVLLDSAAMPTPGFADAREAPFDRCDVAVPVIIPLSPEGRVFHASGDLSITFAALGEHVGRATVYLRSGGDFVPLTATLNHDGVYEAILSSDRVMRSEGHLEYYIEVSGGLYTARFALPEAPITLPVVDNAGPRICSVYPAEGQVLEQPVQPEIKITYEDVSGVNTAISILCFDGYNVSGDAVFDADSVSYVPPKPLAIGTHTVEVTLRDSIGNRTYRKIDFAVGDGKPLYLFGGSVHAHTHHSDGEGTPEEAMRHARDVARMDFFAVTDRARYLCASHYRAQREQAMRFERHGEFAALWGVETACRDRSGYQGSLNILNVNEVVGNREATELAQAFEQLRNTQNALAVFNHPSDEWGCFDAPVPVEATVRDRACLVDIKGSEDDRHYAELLARGWRVAPVYSRERRVGDRAGMGFVLAPSLTRENILDGMRRRRTYATDDATMQILYRVNGVPLGSVLTSPDRLIVEIEVATEHAEGIGRLQLMCEDRMVIAEVDAGVLRRFSWQIELDPDFDYYYLRITNGACYSVTAPVFVEGRDLLNITAMEYGVTEACEDPYAVSVTVANDGDKALSNVTVDFYLGTEDGFLLRHLAPAETVEIGVLESGETVTVSCCLADVRDKRRVSAVVSGMAGKQRYADTAYVLLSPLTVSKLLPVSTPLTGAEMAIENPFAYIELHNPTPILRSLDGYFLKVKGEDRRAAERKTSLALDGMRIPPFGTLVIWLDPTGGRLTAEDFNTRYGTSLIEHEDLVRADAELLSCLGEDGVLDLCLGEVPICRVLLGGGEPVVDMPTVCRSLPRRTPVAERLLLTDPLLPGQLHVLQQPHTVTELPERALPTEVTEEQAKQRVITRLTKASLVPFRAAALVAGALSAFRGFFGDKE